MAVPLLHRQRGAALRPGGHRPAPAGRGGTPFASGDSLAFPADEHGAHRVVNDTAGPLRYLLVSTMVEPDVTLYPDSEKIGVFVGAPPGGEGDRPVHGYYRRDGDVDYLEGEPSSG